MRLFGFEITVGRAPKALTAAEEAIFERSQGRGVLSTTGANVSPESAATLADVFACVKVLAEDIGMIPIMLYERLPGDITQRAASSPLYRLLHDQPNPEMTAYTFKSAMVLNQALWGRAYAEIEYDNAMRVKNLWPIPAKYVTKTRNNAVPSGSTLPVYLSDQPATAIVYRVEIPGYRAAVLPDNRVLHIMGLSSDGLEGLSPITTARETLGIALAQENTVANFYKNGAQPKGFLKRPAGSAVVKDAGLQVIRDEWDAAHGGLQNSQRVAILQEGTDYQAISLSPADAQLIQSRQFTTTQIARLYRMPLHKIMEMGRQTWGNVEQMSIEYVYGTLLPWIVNWEQALCWKILNDAQKPRYYYEFLIENLLRGDFKSRMEGYTSAINNTIMTPNEARRRENLPPLPGGDDLRAQVNTAPVTSIPALPASAPDTSTGDDNAQ